MAGTNRDVRPGPHCEAVKKSNSGDFSIEERAPHPEETVMYEEYWNLERNPFQDDAELSGYYASDTHHATLLKLRYLIENGKEAGLLAGGSGLGKSYLLQVLSR